jgi:hypothetical protein
MDLFVPLSAYSFHDLVSANLLCVTGHVTVVCLMRHCCMIYMAVGGDASIAGLEEARSDFHNRVRGHILRPLEQWSDALTVVEVRSLLIRLQLALQKQRAYSNGSTDELTFVLWSMGLAWGAIAPTFADMLLLCGLAAAAAAAAGGWSSVCLSSGIGIVQGLGC